MANECSARMRKCLVRTWKNQDPWESFPVFASSEASSKAGHGQALQHHIYIYIYIMIKTKRFIKLYWYGIELCMCYCSITQTDRSIAEMLARHPNKKQHGCRAPGDPRVVLCQSGATKRTKNETSADILDRC